MSLLEHMLYQMLTYDLVKCIVCHGFFPRPSNSIDTYSPQLGRIVRYINGIGSKNDKSEMKTFYQTHMNAGSQSAIGSTTIKRAFTLSTFDPNCGKVSAWIPFLLMYTLTLHETMTNPETDHPLSHGLYCGTPHSHPSAPYDNLYLRPCALHEDPKDPNDKHKCDKIGDFKIHQTTDSNATLRSLTGHAYLAFRFVEKRWINNPHHTSICKIVSKYQNREGILHYNAEHDPTPTSTEKDSSGSGNRINKTKLREDLSNLANTVNLAIHKINTKKGPAYTSLKACSNQILSITKNHNMGEFTSLSEFAKFAEGQAKKGDSTTTTVTPTKKHKLSPPNESSLGKNSEWTLHVAQRKMCDIANMTSSGLKTLGSNKKKRKKNFIKIYGLDGDDARDVEVPPTVTFYSVGNISTIWNIRHKKATPTKNSKPTWEEELINLSKECVHHGWHLTLSNLLDYVWETKPNHDKETIALVPLEVHAKMNERNLCSE